jgi:putative tryptophan/tyrosine transport system substrate-binding protein
MSMRDGTAASARAIGLCLVVLAALLAAPLQAWAQAQAQAQAQARIFTIGFLGSGTSTASAASVDAFRDGLRELGWIEGRNIVVDYRFAEGRVERLPDLAAALVQKKVDLIVALPSASTVAAHNATRSMPIVAVSIADPVNLGLANSLARPGGNVTGLTFSVGLEVWAKQLQLLKEVVPSARRMAVLLNPGNPGHALGVGPLKAASQTLGVSLQWVEVRAPEEIGIAFAAMARERADALLVLGDPLFSSHAERLAALAISGRLATMHGTRQNVEGGGLMMYAPDLRFQARQAAAYVDKILKGAQPAELAFEQPKKFEFVINMKTARALGLVLPPSLLLRADQFLE